MGALFSVYHGEMAGGGEQHHDADDADDVAAAREAAARLPRAASAQASGEPGASRSEQIGFFALLAVTFIGGSVWLFVQLWRESWGWLMILGGLPVYLVARVLFFRLRGTETGSVAVDGAGVIHVIRGRSAVRRFQRLYDVGGVRWMRYAVVGGFLLPIIGLPALAAVAVVFDAPWLLMVFLTTTAFACLDLLRIFGLSIWSRDPGHTMLDAYVMLPALALYARHHGYRAAISGVPADRLAATLAANPEDWNTAQEYGDVARAMARMAGGSNPGG